MKKNSLFIFSILMLLPYKADAFEMNLLKNDKELVSHAYSKIDLFRAERQVSPWAEQAFDLLGASFQELENEKKLCDLSLHQRFANKLDAAGIPSSAKQIHLLYTLWRSHQRIDDLFFEIMEQAGETHDSISWFEVQKPQNWEIQEMKNLINEFKITKYDLEDLYSSFKRHSIQSPDCTINRWQGVREQIASIANNRDSTRLFNIAAKDFGILNDDEFALVEAYRINGVGEWKINLSRYLQLIKEVKNRSVGTNPRGSTFEPNELSSKIISRKLKITYRQSLYYRFNGTQIKMIEGLLKKTFDRMDATKTEIIFTYQNGSETVPISPMGQYYLARKLLRKDMEDLNRSSFFSGSPITHEDLVAAGLETGLLNRELLESVLKIDNLWNPEVKKWQKISNYAFRVTGTATIFLPPPYNVISSMALVFLDGALMRKSRKASQADPDYDVF